VKRRSLRRSRLAVAAIATLLAVGAEAASDSYAKGLEAMDARRWADAVRLMREAIADKPEEGGRIRLYGMNFVDYLPHFQLGLALYNSGDCAGAVAAWGASESQGAIQKNGKLFEALTESRKDCQTRVAAKPTPEPPKRPDPAEVRRALAAAESAVTAAGAAADRLQEQQRDPALAGGWSDDPALGRAQSGAQDRLRRARAELDSGKSASDLTRLAEARKLAADAQTAFDGALEAARRKRVARAADPTPAPRRPTPAPATPTPVMPTPAPTATPERAATAPTPPGPPPPALRSAATAFLAGRYQEAVVVDPEQLPVGPPRAHGLLFRSAALYALYLLDGSRDLALLERAQQDVRACRQTAADLTPDERAFSPRYREFFQATR
jgi:hypothetical protein